MLLKLNIYEGGILILDSTQIQELILPLASPGHEPLFCEIHTPIRSYSIAWDQAQQIEDAIRQDFTFDRSPALS